MQYIAAVSGKGQEVDEVKEQLLQSNPVLEGKFRYRHLLFTIDFYRIFLKPLAMLRLIAMTIVQDLENIWILNSILKEIPLVEL